ncbi:MAG: serine protease [Desulfobacteraceae bacterium]|nr:MAG: serine protease [Desulfobacteraceae bacterium]
MLSPKSIAIPVITAFLIIFSNNCIADDIASAGRSIFNNHQEAVVRVSLIIKFRLFMNGNEKKKSESKTETTGTILTPAGLTLISLNTTEPDKMAEENIKRKTGSQMRLESELGDIIIILSDGKEIPGTIVLRDRDLDLAFIRPAKENELSFHSLWTVKKGTPEVMDLVFSLGRLPKLGSRAATISMDRIHAIVTKPRTVYIPFFTRELGAPIFAENGSWIGNMLLRYNPSGDTNPPAMFVILPADDIMEIAAQAPKIETPANELK